MYTIRSYEDKDKKRVEAICLSPDRPESVDSEKKDDPFSQMTLEAFCHYYVEQEPENCFVAVNEKDEVVGYILCAVNFPVWEEKFTELYLEKTQNPITKAVGKGTIDGLKPYSVEYPAHLHIDLAGSCQRQGVGTKLMNTLLAHLEEKGVFGVMFSVASDNEKGLGFYRKYGFAELGRSEREITMGKKLGNK